MSEPLITKEIIAVATCAMLQEIIDHAYPIHIQIGKPGDGTLLILKDERERDVFCKAILFSQYRLWSSAKALHGANAELTIPQSER